MNRHSLRRILLPLSALIVAGIACSPGANIPFLSSGERPLYVCAVHDSTGEFGLDEAPGIFRLTNLDGEVEVERIGNSSDHYRVVRVSPTGQQIAYVLVDEDTDNDGALNEYDEPHAFIANADGSEEVEIDPPGDLERGTYIVPVWSKNGSRLLLIYRNYDTGSSDSDPVQIVDSSGELEDELDWDDYQDSEELLAEFSTLISPDGKRRLWLLDSTEWAISAAGEDEGDAETLDGLPESDERYSFFGWSPDSQSILVGVGLFDPALYVFDPDAEEATQIAERGDVTFLVRWSPDGSQIVFAAPASGNNAGATRLYLMTADGEDRERLLDDEYGRFGCLDW